MGGYIVFFTLTTSFESDPDLILKYWADYRHLIKYYGYQHEYVITVERKGGLAHIHGIGDRFVPYPVMMGCWNTATRKTAWKVDVRKVDMWSAPSGYLVKYITKSPGNGGSKKSRKIAFSQGFPKRPKCLNEKGRYVYMTYDDYGSIKHLVN